jgi:hypothetical protein
MLKAAELNVLYIYIGYTVFVVPLWINGDLEVFRFGGIGYRLEEVRDGLSLTCTYCTTMSRMDAAPCRLITFSIYYTEYVNFRANAIISYCK